MAVTTHAVTPKVVAPPVVSWEGFKRKRARANCSRSRETRAGPSAKRIHVNFGGPTQQDLDALLVDLASIRILDSDRMSSRP